MKVEFQWKDHTGRGLFRFIQKKLGECHYFDKLSTTIKEVL